jgi:prepilin peptidase CpaA
MHTDWYFLALGLAFLGTLSFATVADIKARTVPNLVSIGLVILFGLWFLPQAGLATLGSALGAFAIALSVTFLLWHFDIIGGADVKVFSACALFAGLDGLGQYASWTALVGGVAACAMLLIAFLRKGPTRAVKDARTGRGGRTSVPYVIAISCGAIITAISENWFRLAA